MSAANGAGTGRRGARGRPPSTRRVIVETTLVCLAVGLLGGVLWRALAPQFSVEVIAGQLQPAGPVGESRFGADAWFAAMGIVAGALIALAMFTRHRHRPVETIAALALAGLVGSVVAWRVGLLLGPEPVPAELEEVADGTSFEFPLALGATGVLLAWPIASLVCVLAMTLLGDHRPGDDAEVSRDDRFEPWSHR